MGGNGVNGCGYKRIRKYWNIKRTLIDGQEYYCGERLKLERNASARRT